MNQEQRDRIERLCVALESGTYKQAKSALRKHIEGDGLGHCCLGVACELFHQETGQGEWITNTDNADLFVAKPGDSSRTTLPNEVTGYFGISGSAHGDPFLKLGKFKDDWRAASSIGSAVKASSANDSDGFTFAEIAYMFRLTFLDGPA